VQSCGKFAGISRARLCSVVTIATGVPWQVIEFKAYFERSSELIMPGSRVRVPPFPPAFFGFVPASLADCERVAGASAAGGIFAQRAPLDEIQDVAVSSVLRALGQLGPFRGGELSHEAVKKLV